MNLKKIFQKRIKISIAEVSLAGILIALYLIAGRFIDLNIQGIMHVGITYIFLIMFGIFFGPIKSVFFALIADTLKMLITTGIGQWMWEYEIITVGIPIMAWIFKMSFEGNKKRWWIIMIVINLVSLFGIIAVVSLADNGGALKHASKHSYDFNNETMIMIYVIASLFYVLQAILFIFYKKNKNKELKTIILFSSLVTMIVIVWIWIWGPIAYIRYLQRFGTKPSDHYTYEAYYKIALWARILKTPIIIPIYTMILVPLYKASIYIKNNISNYSH